MGFVCFWFFFVKVSRRLDLVYGGGSVGLMGLVSQEVHRGGGHVLGYIYTVIGKLHALLDMVFLFHFPDFFFFILVHRIIPKTLMCKEVEKLIWVFVFFS